MCTQRARGSTHWCTFHISHTYIRITDGHRSVIRIIHQCGAHLMSGHEMCTHHFTYESRVNSTCKPRVNHCAAHCNTLQHAATHCNTLQHESHVNSTCKPRMNHCAAHCNTLCNTLQHTATHCATHSSTLQHTVQHTATHT